MSAEGSATPAPPRQRGWGHRIATALALLLAVLTLGIVTLDSDIGHRLVIDRIGALRPANGLRYSVGRIDGSLFNHATIVDFRLRDPHGLVLYVPRAEVRWAPLAWLHNRLDITSLVIPQARLFKLPQPAPTGRAGPILPGFDIRIGRLQVDRLGVAPAITGVARRGRLIGRADIRNGHALIDLAAVVAGSDTLNLRLDAAPDRDRFDVDLHARGTASGLLAKASGFAQPIAADLHGDGRWRAWRGRAIADIGRVRLADLTLGNRAGSYTLGGTITLAPLTHGKIQRLSGPRIAVNGSATLIERRLAGALDLHSAALALHTEGALDLGASAFRGVRLRARLLQPAALFPNMTGRAIELRMILNGAFATAAFDYRLAADRVAFDKTGFEEVRAAGKGHLSRAPVLLPVRLTAARVTGIGDVAGGILRNLSIDGILRVTAKLVTGDDLRLASDKLNGRASLMLDLANGHYEVGLNGGLSRFLIPELGLVEVNSLLHVVPGPGGHGTRVIGKGSARMLRLDNGFFRSLAGGLPGLVTDLERTTDGVLHFSNLVLTGPQIRITGAGLRRRDGTFHFEGAGKQASYGPLTLKLDGKIDKPTLDLVFQQPNAAMGLSNVIAHLDPVAAGFAFSAHGGSRLGPFDGAGMILLPKGGQAVISIAQLNVSNTHAHGDLTIVDGGFDGQLSVTGGGLGGSLLFRPQDAHQRIEAHLDATGARIAQAVTVRRGHLDLTALLDPAGTTIDATATASGLRRGSLTIGRTAIHAALRGGSGEIRAAIAGSRGRAFSIQSVITVSPDRYAVSAQGTVDRKPLQLTTPAVFSRAGDGWRLAPVRLAFAGGEADLSGSFTGTASAVDATLAKMPLSVLDIGYPGLGLGGEASGKLSFVQSREAAPTGRINMTVRGLTRSGLVLSSRPVDVGIAGVLEPGRAAARAVAASGGKTVGRAQLLLTLPGGADLPARIAHAPLFAQLRYDGPADTLWRLTGIELFDLSGPVAIGADVGGTLDNPRIRGVLQANGAKIESATTGTVLTNVVANGRFGGSRLVIDRLTADAGKGGRVTGTGSFDFAAANGFGMDVSMQAQTALLINRDDIAATVTGPLTFRSDGAGGTIAGKVTLTKSRYRLGQATAASAVPQLNIREINLPGGGEEDEAPRKPWKLAVHAHAPNNLLVTGLGLRSEWSADLDLAGAPDNPAITGRADLIRGDYQFAGREFQLDRGKILFTGDVPANPALDIAANADTTGLSATIRVTGPALKPEISFTSTPALPEDELLSRLLFGTSITNLSAPEALQLASAVAALQNGKGGLDPINAVRRVAGLDRLRILPADPQTGAGTSVAAGKYVTRRLFAEIITDGQGYSATQVEFQVTRWLSVLSTISTLGRQSGNLRVSKDY